MNKVTLFITIVLFISVTILLILQIRSKQPTRMDILNFDNMRMYESIDSRLDNKRIVIQKLPTGISVYYKNNE